MKENKTLKLSMLVENPDNTRIHTDRQIAEFAKSIDMFGVIRPIVVDENNMILVGHGLKKALEYMGKEEAECLVLTGLSDTQKKKLLLSDNKIYKLGVDDFDVIDRLMHEMNDFEIPGYNPEDLELIYGASSVAEDANEFKMKEEVVKERIEKSEKIDEIKHDGSDIDVPASVQEQREKYQEAQADNKFIICPNCGEKIYVD